jgi:hypothetical protein
LPAAVCVEDGHGGGDSGYPSSIPSTRIVRAARRSQQRLRLGFRRLGTMAQSGGRTRVRSAREGEREEDWVKGEDRGEV